MDGGWWNSQRFAGELAANLTVMLAESRELETLDRAVATCATAAEAACSGRVVACGAGCPHCCVLNVAILLPEGLVIAEWLRERLPSSAVEALCERLSSHSNWARWMTDEERIHRQAGCPFLDDAGRCFIHPVRPLVCRAVSSFDRHGCRAAFDPILSDQDRLVPSDRLRQSAFDSAFMVLAEALRHQGLDDRSIELGTGVLAFLDYPDYRDRFLAGETLPRELWTF